MDFTMVTDIAYMKRETYNCCIRTRSNMIDDVKKTAVSLIESSCAGIAVMLLILIFTSKLIVMPIAKSTPQAERRIHNICKS